VIVEMLQEHAPKLIELGFGGLELVGGIFEEAKKDKAAKRAAAAAATPAADPVPPEPTVPDVVVEPVSGEDAYETAMNAPQNDAPAGEDAPPSSDDSEEPAA
jgi:hypothetical protein